MPTCHVGRDRFSRRLPMDNHTHTWRYNMSPLTSLLSAISSPLPWLAFPSVSPNSRPPSPLSSPLSPLPFPVLNSFPHLFHHALLLPCTLCFNLTRNVVINYSIHLQKNNLQFSVSVWLDRGVHGPSKLIARQTNIKAFQIGDYIMEKRERGRGRERETNMH